MFEALRELAGVMGVDPAGRPWKEVLNEMCEIAQTHRASHDYLTEPLYEDYLDQYPDDDYYDGDSDDEYLYDEGLDYLQGGGW